MQSRLSFPLRQISFLLLVWCAGAAMPQSHNREAMKWFNAALAEKNPQKRLEAYTKAVEIDPAFSEALFNLGVTYKEQKDYARAEPYLHGAYQAQPAEAKTALRLKALGELAQIYNVRGDSQNYESALREARTLSRDQKQRAVLSYELGRWLYQQGRYEQAAAELKEGRAGDAADHEAFDNLLTLAEDTARLKSEAEKSAWAVTARTISPRGADFKLEIEITALNVLPLGIESAAPPALPMATNTTLPLSPETILAAHAPAAMDSTGAETPVAKEAALDSLYVVALAAVKREDWNEAVINFQKIRLARPTYRNVDALFSKARTKLLSAVDTAETISIERPSPFALAALALIMSGSFLTGFAFFSPAYRARYRAWRGNDRAAALIYESLLARKPSRLKHYPALAEIYLRLDRRDGTAVKIYKRILELNLPTSRRAEINAIVATRAVVENQNVEDMRARLETYRQRDQEKAESNGAHENGAVTNGIVAGGGLLANGKFKQTENTAPKRPRKRKEANAAPASENGGLPAPNSALPAVNEKAPLEHTVAPKKSRKKMASLISRNGENSVVLSSGPPLEEDAAPMAPTKPKRPRKKKEAATNGTTPRLAENGAAAAPHGDVSFKTSFDAATLNRANGVVLLETESPSNELSAAF